MKNNPWILKSVVVILTTLFLVSIPSCAQDTLQPTVLIEYKYPVPEEIDDGLETASLASVGIDESFLIELLKDLDQIEDHRIHSLLIIKNEKLVFEEYFPGDKFNLAQFTEETGFAMEDTHNLCSVTKSFTSAILGIAFDQGYLQSVDQRVSEFFPEFSDLFLNNPEKQKLTLKNLLTMTSGVDWDDESTSYFDEDNDMYQMFMSQDPIEYILSKDSVLTPGTVFEYSNCNTNLIGEIIHRSTKMRIDEFAKRFLFSKLGIKDFEWQMISEDVVFTSGDLRLRPRDMAKFGYLFLNDGEWQGERVISQDWIDQSTSMHIDLSSPPNIVDWADGYGYQWWMWEDIHGVEFQAYFASGWGGQWIIVSPALQLVVVSTAGNYYSPMKMPIENILTEYILPSIESN
jgi:CubicO group peptidase (beta-lactamase class C family)